MGVGDKTVSDTSPQRGEVGRGAPCGRCAPSLRALRGFPPPASPRWGKGQGRGHVAVGLLLRAQVSYSWIMSTVKPRTNLWHTINRVSTAASWHRAIVFR